MQFIWDILDGINARLSEENSEHKVSTPINIVVTSFVILILGIMILPLSSSTIDFLITINLTVSISLLLLALYIPRTTRLFIFPSLIFATTFYSFGLNISTTRTILLKANAGDIIKGFGDFVVGGNYVVGDIFFLIITVVLFIAINKIVKKIAKTTTRFNLDTIPSRQMSINADLRAGNSDTNQARLKETVIQKKNQFYSSMNVAMKFVKKYAIIGIIITIINIIGGITIGVVMNRMSVNDSAQFYSLLFIGDGLVFQIPTLLIALTADTVTARVAIKERSETSSQPLKQPKSLMIATAILVASAVIPGLPLTPFVILAFVILAFVILAFVIGIIDYALWNRD